MQALDRPAPDAVPPNAPAYRRFRMSAVPVFTPVFKQVCCYFHVSLVAGDGSGFTVLLVRAAMND